MRHLLLVVLTWAAFSYGGIPQVVVEAIPNGVRNLAVDTDFIYFSSLVAINRVPKEGGPITQLTKLGGPPSALAVTPTHVYWTVTTSDNTGGLYRCPIKGGEREQVGAGSGSLAMAMTKTHAYWSYQALDQTPGGIKKTSLNNGETATLVSGVTNVSALSIDDKWLYWPQFAENEGRIYKVPLEGGTPVPLIEKAKFPFRTAVKDKYLYWGELGGGLQTSDLDGHNVRALTTAGFPIALVADEKHLFYMNLADRVLWRIRLNGDLMTELTASAGNPNLSAQLIVDETYLYWVQDVNNLGQILRIEKD